MLSFRSYSQNASTPSEDLHQSLPQCTSCAPAEAVGKLGPISFKDPCAGVRNLLGLRGIDQTHLNLVYAQTIHPGHKTGQGGFSCSTDTDQKQVALRLAEYPDIIRKGN